MQSLVAYNALCFSCSWFVACLITYYFWLSLLSNWFWFFNTYNWLSLWNTHKQLVSWFETYLRCLTSISVFMSCSGNWYWFCFWFWFYSQEPYYFPCSCFLLALFTLYCILLYAACLNNPCPYSPYCFFYSIYFAL